MRIVLGSGSPRRKDLLSNLGYDYRIVVSDAEERYPKEMAKNEIAEYLAVLKSKDLRAHLENDELLITADTLVLCNNRVIEKPKNEQEALEMLSILQNNSHEVYSGVCLYSMGQQSSFTERSSVFMSACDEKELRQYIQRYQPFDKAGSYGIQDWIGYAKVHRIEGCYYNVMGLPTARLYKELMAFMKRRENDK